MKRYFINGFQEKEGYFFDVGRFTEEERQKLEDGEIVIKGDNEFIILECKEF